MATFDDNGTAISPAKAGGIEIVGHASGVDKNYDFDAWLDAFDTDDLTEGATNFWYTDERVDDRVASLIQNGTGIGWTYVDGSNTLTANLQDPSTEDQNIRLVAISTGVINGTAIGTLNSVPVVITATPPANGTIAPVTLGVRMSKPAGAAWTSNNILVEDVATGQTLATIPAAVLTDGRMVIVNFDNAPSTFNAGGSGIQLKIQTTDPSGGDSGDSLKYEITYRIIDFDTIS